jgi:shikimate 5-dehydrogenase
MKRFDLSWRSDNRPIDLLINATPSDDVIALETLMKVSKMLIDVKMSESKTRLQTRAEELGLSMASGIDFFCYQFVKQFKYYFDIDLTQQEMTSAISILL